MRASLIIPCFANDKLIGIYHGYVYEERIDLSQNIGCTLEIYAGNNGTLNIKAVYEMDIFSEDRVFNFQVKNLKHPATDPGWRDVDSNFSEYIYAYIDSKSSGESFVLYLDKSTGSLRPIHYSVNLSRSDVEAKAYLDGVEYPWYTCEFR